MFILVRLQGWGREVSGGMQCLSVLNGSVLPYWPRAQRGLEGQGDSLEYIQTGFFEALGSPGRLPAWPGLLPACPNCDSSHVSHPIPHLHGLEPPGTPAPTALPTQPIPPAQEMLGERLCPGYPVGLGAHSHSRPWPLAQGRVGNHRFYFWVSPWEVLQQGGREHPDLVPEVLEVLSLEQVIHTHAQGMAVLGTGRGGMSCTSPLPYPSSL